MPSQSFSRPRGPTPPHQAGLSRHQCPSKASPSSGGQPHTSPCPQQSLPDSLASQSRSQLCPPVCPQQSQSGLIDSQASNKSCPLGHLQQSQPFLHSSQPGTKPAGQHICSNQCPTTIGAYTQSTDHIPGASGSGDQGYCTRGFCRTPSI